MTTYSLSTYVTALELARQMDPKGALVPLIQSLSVLIPIFADVHMEECNDGSGHNVTTEYYQPVGQWRMFNEGVDTEAPITADFREPTAMINSIFETDRAMLFRKAKGDGAKAAMLRSRMLSQFYAGMLKTISTSMLYGTRTDGKSPRGLFVRSDLNSLSSAYVHDNAGGAASATENKSSLLLIGHGSQKYHWIYPEGIAPPSDTITQPGAAITGFGIRNDPLPDGLAYDVGGSKRFLAVRNWLTADVGHAVEDARYVQRIVNISNTGIDGIDDFGFDEEVAIDAVAAMPDIENSTWYCNKGIQAQIRKRNNNKGNVFYKPEEPNAPEVLRLCGIPVHPWDSMTATEAKVS